MTREMRSLERRSMYSIFAPLDPDERLPRELLLERRAPIPWPLWGFVMGRQHVAGLLWLPAMLLTLALFTWLGNPLAALVAVGLLLVAFTVGAFRQGN
jgi:hypothetical protein